MMLLAIVYVIGCALTGVYVLKNLDPVEIGDYFKSVAVIVCMVWPILVVAVIVLTLYTLLKNLRRV